MSTQNTLSKPAVIRRTLFAFQTIALVFAVTACCAFAGILADRFPKRFDATSTREHHLSPRTESLLTSLNGDYEVVVAANFSTLDPAAARRTQDVLDNFSRTSTHVQTTIIDVSSAKGTTDLDALLTRLVERFKPDFDKQAAGLVRADQATTGFETTLNQLAEHLTGLRKSVQDKDPNAALIKSTLDRFASECTFAAENLAKARKSAKDTASQGVGGHSPVPATDDAVALMRITISSTLEKLTGISDTLSTMAQTADETKIAPELRSLSRAPAAEAATLRTQIGQLLGAIDDLPRTPVASVLRVLERTSAAIVIAPPSPDRRSTVTSVELSAIFPPRTAGDQEGIHLDLRARTEELLAGAIASLSRGDVPIVVFVHGDNRRIAPDYPLLHAALERFSLRGVDVAEWPVAVDAEPPSLSTLNPGGKRPVVHIVFSMGVLKNDDAPRFTKLVDASKRLIKSGERVLFCELPSGSQALGQKDPMADLLEPLGFKLDSGKVLLHQTTGPRGRVVNSDTLVTDPGTTHPIGNAIRGLTTYFPWAVPIGAIDTTHGVQPAVTIDSKSRDVWAESEWTGFSQIRREDQQLLTNPPAPDPNHDDIFGCWPLSAPTGWPIVATVERTGPKGQQRIEVVGSAKWILDENLGAAALYPGNMEFLDASIHWLAGQESLISASATAREVPRIPALSDGALSALRWGLIGGLPILILLVGAVWRLLRG